MDKPKSDPHPSVAAAVMFPGFGLALRSLLDFYFVRWVSAASLAVVVAVMFLYAVTRTDSGWRATSIFGLIFIGVAYGYGAGWR